MSDKKKKKNKVRYIDDGSTVYDMSALRQNKNFSGKRGTPKEQFTTYMRAVKQMIIPMLVTMAIISAVFGILYLLLCLAE
jgi:hypothetical protein